MSTSEENCKWLRDKITERGLTKAVEVEALALFVLAFGELERQA